jgi:hypothetical protein
MKHNLKNEIHSLINGQKKRKDILVCDTYNCEPGFYRHNGKTISEAELIELKKGYNQSVVFNLAKDKKIIPENIDRNHLNIEVDDIKTAESFLKLRQIKN